MKRISALNQTYSLFKETYRELQSSSDNPETLNQEKMDWAQSTLKRFNINLEVEGKVILDPAALFLGNHISYMDIPLLLASARGISFVAKHEISRWPIFGLGAKKLDTIFVKRGKKDSKKKAAKSIEESLSAGKRIVVFPSGTTSINGHKAWRKGIFDIACSTNCWTQPFRITYEPLREVAYIDDDFFPTHVFRLFGTENIRAKIEFHEPVKIKDALSDCNKWQDWVQESFHLDITP